MSKKHANGEESEMGDNVINKSAKGMCVNSVERGHVKSWMNVSANIEDTNRSWSSFFHPLLSSFMGANWYRDSSAAIA